MKTERQLVIDHEKRTGRYSDLKNHVDNQHRLSDREQIYFEKYLDQLDKTIKLTLEVSNGNTI